MSLYENVFAGFTSNYDLHHVLGSKKSNIISSYYILYYKT